MMRFLVPHIVLDTDTVTIPADICHHAFRVRRLRVGELFTINNGCGSSATAIIDEWTHGPGIARIVDRIELHTELPIDIVVCQALPKSPERIEQVLQHGTELGAAAFLVFAGERSVAKLDSNDKVNKRLERWNSIVRSAAEQSGRAVLPTVTWYSGLNQVVKSLDAQLLVLHEESDTPIQSVASTAIATKTRLALVVGPEGGLSHSEVECCLKNGGAALSLGPRILRTETAALAAIAQLSFVLENVTTN